MFAVYQTWGFSCNDLNTANGNCMIYVQGEKK